MRYSNFLFPESRSPETDGAILDEVMQEVRLSEELGMDAVWLGEHHFDGNCCYVDPIAFSAAVAMATSRIRIGYAVAQVSLHHPTRLAEQIALIDNLSKGRLIVGLGRGTNFNIYEYEGYGIPAADAQQRFEEAEQIMLRAWSGEPVDHEGTYWQVNIPALRPACFTRPHPFVIRSASGEASMVELARQGRPFLMSVQSNETTRSRLDLYRRTMRESGASEAAIATALDQCWAWRNVYVGETDAEAEAIGVPAFLAMHAQRSVLRDRIAAERAVGMGAPRPGMARRVDPAVGLVCGSPDTVAEAMAELKATGIGGVIITFRLGAMPYEVAAASIRRFMEKVVPQLEQPPTARAA